MKKPRRSGALDGYGVWWLITSTPPTHNGFSDVADSLEAWGVLGRNLGAIFMLLLLQPQRLAKVQQIPHRTRPH